MFKDAELAGGIIFEYNRLLINELFAFYCWLISQRFTLQNLRTFER
jgi:hypothetical protein